MGSIQAKKSRNLTSKGAATRGLEQTLRQLYKPPNTHFVKRMIRCNATRWSEYGTASVIDVDAAVAVLREAAAPASIISILADS